MLLLKSFQLSLSLLHIMLIFDTESHIWAFLGLFFIFSLFLFSLFIELTWAKRALDSSHCPASHCQARLLYTALQDTLIFLGLYPHSFLPSICFLGEWAARQGLVCGQDKLLFCSPDKGWKTTLPHHSCTQTHGHICTEDIQAHPFTQVDTGAHTQTQHDASTEQWSMYRKVILPCEPVALGEFVCSASEQLKKCVHMSIYTATSL